MILAPAATASCSPWWTSWSPARCGSSRPTAESGLWDIWIRGYRETLELLERGERGAAVERYRRIYTEYRARVETLLFDEPGGD